MNDAAAVTTTVENPSDDLLPLAFENDAGSPDEILSLVQEDDRARSNVTTAHDVRIDPVDDDTSLARMTEFIKRRDAREASPGQALRDALRSLQPLIADPGAVAFHFEAAALEQWRTLRDGDPHVFTTHFAEFRRRNGYELSQLLVKNIGAPPADARKPAVPTWPQAIDLEALAESEPHPPQSIMEGLPTGYATGTFGHGGAGKSQIELMRAVSIAAGVAFCDIEVERRVVTVLSCEDRSDVLHWRLSRICKHYGISLANLKGWLHILDLVGHDSLLYAPDPRSGGDAFTAAYGMLATHMRESGSDVLVIDGISDTYGSNENARGPVKRFVNGLLALISPERGALLLIGHVNKMTATGGTTTEGYSGSTSWHNSCRSRWYLYPEVEHDDNGGQRSGKLILELQKSNHGEVGAQIEFAWDDDAHLFIGRQVGTSRFDQQHQQREERRGILRAFADCAAASVVVPAALTGQRTAYHVLSIQARFPDTLKGGAKPKTRRFWRLIEELRQMRAIEESDYRRKNRHAAAQLIITSEGMRQCV